MTEHAVTSVASVVAGELISRVFSWLVKRYGKDAATSEKLQRLEMLLIKINSAVEVSEKCSIESSSLLQWRDKLKEAALQGVEVLASFTQKVKDAEETSNNNANGDKQQGEAASSTAAPTAGIGPLFFTRNSLSTMVQGICSARNILFSSVDDDMERLNKALGRLEKLSPDVREFIMLLHLQGLPLRARCGAEVDEPPMKLRKRRGNVSMDCSSSLSSMPCLHSGAHPKEEKMEGMPSTINDCLMEETLLSSLVCGSTVFSKELQFKLLRYRLEAAFGEICKAVDLVDSHELEDLEWLAYWAGILREAKEQGRDVLSSTGAHKTINTKDKEETSVECDQEEDELGTFIHRLEGLARDVEYFSKLVDLCPTR